MQDMAPKIAIFKTRMGIHFSISSIIDINLSIIVRSFQLTCVYIAFLLCDYVHVHSFSAFCSSDNGLCQWESCDRNDHIYQNGVSLCFKGMATMEYIPGIYFCQQLDCEYWGI